MTIIAPRRDQPLIGPNAAPTSRSAEYFERVADTLNDVEASIAVIQAATGVYSASNVTTSRTFDADTVTVGELADVVGSLISDLRAAGVIQ